MRNARRTSTLLLAGLSLLVLAGGAAAISPPAGFIDTQVATGLGHPTSMAWDASTARLFITQQEGNLLVVKDGALLGTPFMSLSVNSNGERGLLGVALDPDFATNQYLYVYYTVPTAPVHNRVSRFTAQGDVVAAGSEQILLDLNDLGGSNNHNGGALHFGGDGKLYVAAGENNIPANAQLLTNLLGKILRMNSDGSIPTDNPFYTSQADKNGLIWTYGLRNPFTFAVQPGTGRIFVNDVGQNTYEEVNDGVAGANYGWPNAEGPGNAAYTDPLFCYRHSVANTANCTSTSLTGCALTGGDFYNPPVAYFPAQYVGRYFFSDLCTGFIAQLDPGSGNSVSAFAGGATTPVDVDTGPDGSLYYLQRGGGARVGRISYQDDPTVSTFAPASGATGTKVTIDGTYLAGATAVTFNGVAATFAVVWDTRLVATVPAGATTGPISVTTAGATATSAGNFTTPPAPPSISSFSPTSGPVGTSVTINGTAFNGASAVTFNGTNAQSHTIDSNIKITAVVAAGTTSGTVSVTGPDGTGTSSGSFTVIPAPSISSFTPASGPVGTSVTVNGLNLSGATAVKFSGTNAQSFTVDSNVKITAVVAAGTTSGKASVTTPGGTATSAGAFTVTVPGPSISGFTPATGPAGTIVTINGLRFTGANVVKFHGTNAKSYTVDLDVKVTAVVKPGTTSGTITVARPGGTGTSAGSFTVILPPSISSFTPMSGRAGTVVTINGTGFTGATAVKFHGTKARSFVVNSSTKITAVVRAGTTSGTINVTSPTGKGTSAGSFTVLP